VTPFGKRSPFGLTPAGPSKLKAGAITQNAVLRPHTVVTSAKVATPPPDVPCPTTVPPHLTLPNNPLADITTPIRVKMLKSWLQHYPNELKDRLIQGFSNGFSIGFQGPKYSKLSSNHPSILESPEIVRPMIDKELHMGRIAGPFTTPPLDPFVVSPLGLVPKKELGKFRLIHNLSFPSQLAVNNFIDPVEASVSYEILDNVISLIQN
jgi:hypothetical protein